MRLNVEFRRLLLVHIQQMSLNYIKDSAVQIPNLSAAGDGVDAIVRYYQNGTDEVKNLLKNECSMIYECSYCRSLFRSIINFVAHKRTICRSLHSTIQAEQLEIAKQSLNGQDKDESVAVSKRNTRNTRSLRRFNPANSVAKHIRPVNVRLERANTNIEVQTLPKLVRTTAKTTIVDGKQVVEELPAGLAIKDRIPENRVVLVMPSENSTRYGEMQLRRRRSAYLKKNKEDGSTRELTGEEIAIVERIPSALPVDFINLRCEDARCVKDSQQPFHQLAELAHHLAIQHQIDYTEASLLKKSTPYIKCFLCDVPPFKTLNSLQKHFNAMHSSVRAQHTKYRLEQFNSDSLKRKEAQNYRARSLSPLSDADENGAANDSKQSSEEKTFGTTVESSKKKNVKPGVKPKPLELPKLKYTEEEEHDQRLDAAFALKKWIEATKSDEEENENESEKNEKNCSSTQMKQIIDEEEARKIDQLLNSKAPEKDNKTTESSDQSLVDEGPSSSMALSRSPRSRKPNKKYEDYHDLVNGSGGGKRSVTTTKPSTMTTVREILAQAREAATKETARKSLEFPLKRKLSNEPKMNTKSKFKWKKIKFETPTKTKEVIKEKEKTPVLVKEYEIKDFVLPESIKMNDKQETDGEKEKSSNEKNSGSNTPPSEFSEATSTNSRKIDSSADKSKRNVTPTRLSKGKLPSMLTDRYKEELILYTPRARILKNAEKQKRNFCSEPSRRKQNLNELEEGDGLSMISANVSPSAEKQQQQKTPQSTPARPPPQPKPKDLSAIPIYLTEAQRDLFFKPLKYLFNQNLQDDGLCQCGECGEVLKSVKNGRRHMTSHIRVIRMRCSLCDAGAFYCSDMRIHLMYRYCEKLNLAPEEFISPGTPCMGKERADMLTQLVDPYAPGRIMYSTGKIVSWTNPTAYFPDPKIERNILGPILPGYLSPNASPKKLIRSAILSPKKIRPPQPKEEEKPNDMEKEKPKDMETALEVATTPNEASSSESFSPITSTAKDSLNLGEGGDHNYPVETEKKNEEGNNDVQVEVD